MNSSGNGGGGNNGGGSVGGGNNGDPQQVNEEAVPAANDGGGGRVNFPLFRGNETEYLLALIQDSLLFKPHEIHNLLTRRDMEISPVAPNRPQPPAIFMVHRSVVLNGLQDGYTWRRTVTKQLEVGGVLAIEATRSENTRDFNRTLVRMTYCLTGQRDLFLVYYYLAKELQGFK